MRPHKLNCSKYSYTLFKTASVAVLSIGGQPLHFYYWGLMLADNVNAQSNNSYHCLPRFHVLCALEHIRNQVSINPLTPELLELFP